MAQVVALSNLQDYGAEELELWNETFAAAFVAFVMKGHNDDQSAVAAAEVAHRAVAARRRLFKVFGG